MRSSEPAPLPKGSTRTTRGCAFILLGVVLPLLLLPAGAGIFADAQRRERDLARHLDNAMQLARERLPAMVQHGDRAMLETFLTSLLLDERVVLARIIDENGPVAAQVRPGSEDPAAMRRMAIDQMGAMYLSRKTAIHAAGQPVGEFQIVASRQRLKQTVYRQLYRLAALVLLVGAATGMAVGMIVQRFHVKPLLELRHSVARMTDGDFEAAVARCGQGAIGEVAHALNRMRAAVQQRIKTLRGDKTRLEAHNRTLEQKAAQRAAALAQSAEELQALSNVSCTLCATLDIERVLTRIVRQAVHLSQSDAGTLYECEADEQRFVPRINCGLSDCYIARMRQGGPRPGDQSAISQSFRKRAPYQIPDLNKFLSYPLAYVREAGYRALLAVPLMRDERLIGGLVVRRKAPGLFPDRVVELLQAFAAQSVIAIDNARLFCDLEEKRQALALASRHKSEFLANMSHELRTPLNAIMGYTELILDDIYGAVPERIREILERVQCNARHLRNIITDLLDLSKIEAGRLTLAMDDYALDDIVHTAMMTVEALAAEKKLALHATLPAHLPTGRGDPQRIAQVLLNLLGNAIKFTEEGEIVITVTEDQGTFTVAVSDTGCGIADDECRHIFNEFHQVDGSSTRAKEGTGLGLGIARRIVEMHGGTIWVQSKLKRGSVFRFTLPVRARGPGEAVPQAIDRHRTDHHA